MSDKLSAASLLLAIVAVLYGMWYPLIVASLKTTVPQFAADRRKPHREVVEVRNRYARPLRYAALAVALVFLPDAAGIVGGSLKVGAKEGVRAPLDYDSVATAFILVEAVAIYLAIHFTTEVRAMNELIGRLSESDQVRPPKA